MKEEMNRACLNCGAEMDCKRHSKKYCNDNCKQLAYIKRSHLQSTGSNPIVIAIDKSTNIANDLKENNEEENNIEDLLNEISVRVLKLLDLRKNQNEKRISEGLCVPASFSIQKYTLIK